MGEVYLLLKKMISKKKNKLPLATLPSPYNNIKCTDNSTILGHVMTTDNSTTKAVDNRLNKAKGAWATLRRSFVKKKTSLLSIELSSCMPQLEAFYFISYAVAI